MGVFSGENRFEHPPALHARASFFLPQGESYAGIYIPTLAYNVYNYNMGAASKINLKGIMCVARPRYSTSVAHNSVH